MHGLDRLGKLTRKILPFGLYAYIRWPYGAAVAAGTKQLSSVKAERNANVNNSMPQLHAATTRSKLSGNENQQYVGSLRSLSNSNCVLRQLVKFALTLFYIRHHPFVYRVSKG